MPSSSVHADGPPTVGRGRRRYQAVAALVVVNVLVYVLQLLDGGVADELALRADPGGVLDRPWSIVTVMFLHELLIHLVLMLAVLVVFGAALEKLVRSRFVIAVYFVAGLAGAAGFVATSIALDLAPARRHRGRQPAVDGLGAGKLRRTPGRRRCRAGGWPTPAERRRQAPRDRERSA